jgi:metal-responsive CopG/Arc/MetJ family transcriptional regulator
MGAQGISVIIRVQESMKIAISIEDSLMAQVDAARDLGLSRSELIGEALRDYLRRYHEALSDPSGTSADERNLVKKLRTKLPIPDRW